MSRRSAIRRILRALLRGFFRCCTRLEVRGTAHIPPEGGIVVAMNHLGHLDPLLVIAALPRESEVIALADLYRVPITGQAIRLYDVIPVQRDQLDRNVIRRSLAALQAGMPLILAPEARQSLTGALERARHGAAYLAWHADVPVLPVAITGTAAGEAYAAFRRLQRPRLSITFGPPFRLPPRQDHMSRGDYLEMVTEQIMRRIAAMLPDKYRGYYR